MIFIHGLSGSSSAWLGYERLFEERFNILNLDLLGHGISKKPRDYQAYSVEAQARAISHLLKHLIVGDFIIISHSFGTLIALEILLAHRSNGKRAVFLSPSYAIEKAKLAKITRSLVDIAATMVNLFPCSSSGLGRIDYLRYHNTGDWNVYRMFADVRNTTVRAYLFCLSQMYRFQQITKWRCLSIPALIIHGKSDSLVPVEHALQLHTILQNSRLILLDDADHIIILNNVAEISRAIKKFVECDDSNVS